MNANWHNASVKTPCPVCGHHDWCTISNDGAVCVCRRTPSNRPARSGCGWLHILREDGGRGATRPTIDLVGSAPRADHAMSDFAAIHASFNASEGRLKVMARKLGVSVASLQALDVRYDVKRGAMSFPMRNAEGKIVGLRYRSLVLGEKWSERGSRDGLFLQPPKPPKPPKPPHLLIVEGASDAAAGISLGYETVGRSSCMTGGDELVRLILARGYRDVTVMADNDPPRRGPDGIIRSPGYDGAKLLAEKLSRETPATIRLAFPPDGCKDLREAESHLTGVRFLW